MVLRGNGYCPGHITGFFSIYDRPKEVSKKGSRGAGVNLSQGAIAIAAFTPPDNSDDDLFIELNLSGNEGFRINEDIYRNVLKQLLPNEGKGWAVSLRVRLQLNIGQGFGMSGAGALATSMAVWDAFHSHVKVWDRKIRFGAEREEFFSPRDVNRQMDDLYRTILERRDGEENIPVHYRDCVYAAHSADISTMGGLGDVVAQARGGFEIRLSPGLPPSGDIHNLVINLDRPQKVVILCMGKPVSTSSVLSDNDLRDSINRSGKIALRNLLFQPSIEEFMKESREFTLNSGLANEGLKEALRRGESIENVSMVMIGNSLFSVIDGENVDRRSEELKNIWSEYGKVSTCDIDTFGARPIY